jgi:uncharacterized OB-fold protein
MRQITPKVTAEDRLMNEARDRGYQCPKCGYWNLRHRHMCKRCGIRVRQSDREAAPLRRSSAAVATSREGHRTLRSAPAVQHRR